MSSNWPSQLVQKKGQVKPSCKSTRWVSWDQTNQVQAKSPNTWWPERINAGRFTVDTPVGKIMWNHNWKRGCNKRVPPRTTASRNLPDTLRHKTKVRTNLSVLHEEKNKMIETLRGLGDPEEDDVDLPRLGGSARPLWFTQTTIIELDGNKCIINRVYNFSNITKWSNMELAH